MSLVKAVVNTSPLLILSKINRLSILKEFGQIFAPEAVIAEIKYKKDDVSSLLVTKIFDDWIKTETVKDKHLLNVLTNELDAGEAEVISLAMEKEIEWVILDDQDGRRFAHRYGLKVIGTMGILTWAKKKGLITNLGDEFKKMDKAGFYATDRLKKKLLQEVGE